jgi:1-deoxy-D-xylulose-5-phosphate reductoisomerase
MNDSSSDPRFAEPDRPVRILLLGSTGSIGTQTVEVLAGLERAGRRYEVVGLAAGSNTALLGAQAASLGVQRIAIASVDAPLSAPEGASALRGPDAAEQLVRSCHDDGGVDMVIGAMVGSAGLPATLAALELGIDVALANKETLVAAGQIVVATARRTGAALLPVDSEHSGVWQCLNSDATGFRKPPFAAGPEVTRITLTASGGALRDWPIDRIRRATPEEALAHPNWDMGAKVTIDSASLTNKALELIEAAWLFGVGSDRLGALIHPQSIVHSFVEFSDRSVIAQLGMPDMKTPIQYALTAPDRPIGVAPRLELRQLARLDFAEPDTERFPALQAGFEVIERGGTAGAVFNGANEAAVKAFLAGRVDFGTMTGLARAAMDEIGTSPIRSLDDVLEADTEARRFVHRRLNAPLQA